jgi:hypothetical protein
VEAISDLINKVLGWVFGWYGDDERVKKVRDLTVVGCGFLPTVASVAAMFTAANPAVSGVLGVAVAICEAVKRPAFQGLADMGVYGEVNGVPVEGDFVSGGKE